VASESRRKPGDPVSRSPRAASWLRTSLARGRQQLQRVDITGAGKGTHASKIFTVQDAHRAPSTRKRLSGRGNLLLSPSLPASPRTPKENPSAAGRSAAVSGGPALPPPGPAPCLFYCQRTYQDVSSLEVLTCLGAPTARPGLPLCFYTCTNSTALPGLIYSPIKGSVFSKPPGQLPSPPPSRRGERRNARAPGRCAADHAEERRREDRPAPGAGRRNVAPKRPRPQPQPSSASWRFALLVGVGRGPDGARGRGGRRAALPRGAARCGGLRVDLPPAAFSGLAGEAATPARFPG
jgi:hypothetical protein